MVKYDYILQSVEEYVEKCSNRDLKNRLLQMDEEEKQEELRDILSTEEYSEYQFALKTIEREQKWLKQVEKQLKEHPNSDYWKEEVKDIKDSLKAKTEKVFQYEVQLFRKHEPKGYSLKGYEEGISNEKGEISNQESKKYSSTEEKALRSYFIAGYTSLNENLWEDEELSSSDSVKSRAISRAIHKNGLTQNTVLYNGGHYPTGKIGDPITFKGFTSSSFDKDTAHEFNNGCLYKFLAPKETPCFIANTNNCSHYPQEHEVLLDKDLHGQIVGFDGEYRGVPVVVVQL